MATTEAKRLDELLEHGAVIEMVLGVDTTSLTLAKARLCTDNHGTYLQWCALFPNDQSDVHFTYYDKVALVNDGRDLAIYADGLVFACIMPYEESALNSDTVREAISYWQARLSTNNNAAGFNTFFDEA